MKQIEIKQEKYENLVFHHVIINYPLDFLRGTDHRFSSFLAVRQIMSVRFYKTDNDIGVHFGNGVVLNG